MAEMKPPTQVIHYEPTPTIKELRDRFAIAALTGLVADSEVNFGTQEKLDKGARLCYELADSMLKAREEK